MRTLVHSHISVNHYTQHVEYYRKQAHSCRSFITEWDFTSSGGETGINAVRGPLLDCFASHLAKGKPLLLWAEWSILIVPHVQLANSISRDVQHPEDSGKRQKTLEELFQVCLIATKQTWSHVSAPLFSDSVMMQALKGVRHVTTSTMKQAGNLRGSYSSQKENSGRFGVTTAGFKTLSCG